MEELIVPPSDEIKKVKRIDNLTKLVNPHNGLSDFMWASKDTLKDAFLIQYKNVYGQEECAVFLPSENGKSLWDVYQNDDYGYTKRGEMPLAKASNLDLVRLAGGKPPLGKVHPMKHSKNAELAR